RAPRRADHGLEHPIAAEDERRCHRAPRSLAALDAVGDQGAGRVTRHEVEVGELVVQHEAAHHLVTAERALDRAGHGDGIALAIDDRDVRRAVLDGIAHARLRAASAGCARTGPTHAALHVDATRAFAE